MRARTYNPPLIRYEYSHRTRRVYQVRVLKVEKQCGEWVARYTTKEGRWTASACCNGKLKLPGHPTKLAAVNAWLRYIQEDIIRIDQRLALEVRAHQHERDRLIVQLDRTTRASTKFSK